jgi:superfamily II DNA or RNA helicase
MQLRQYQIDFTANIRTTLAHTKKIIACSATGSGKTKVFLAIANTAIQKKTTVLILTESRKIFKQIAEEKPEAVEIKAGIKHIWIEPGKLYVAMAQTLAKRPFIIAQLQLLNNRLLIINDEAHIGTATKLLNQLPEPYLIGFTATPDYKVAKHLPTIYNGIVIGPQPQELVEMGYLSPYYHYERKSADLNSLQKKGGEFTEASQYDAFDKPKVFAGLHEDLGKYSYKKAIIFCSSIKHCANLTEELRAKGYQCAEVHSENKNSDIELSNFMHGQTPICVSVGILTKGFDFPEIDLVILQRATTSLALYCQMIGRGSRIATNKTRFTVLDYGGNATRHGLWNYEHDWATKWMKQGKDKKEGVAPVKECPECFLLVSAKTNICPECGHEFNSKKNTEFAEGEMVSVTQEYDKIRGKLIAELAPYELYSYAKATNKKAYAKRIAQAQGQEFLSSYAIAAGWKYGWSYKIKADTKIPFHNILIR